jgi:NAD kinase
MSVAREPTVGLIANPMSGRDVRRLLGRALQQTPEMKRNTVQRAVIGAVAGGARRVLLMRDIFRSAESAVESLQLHAEIGFLDLPLETAASDTARAGEALRKAGCGAVVVLGGDGINRVLAKDWRDVPVVPISTGTNNVLPKQIEATVAGAAAGLVACEAVSLSEVTRPAKVIEVEFADGRRDLALVDAALLEGDHAGSLLHFDPAQLRHLLLTRAEPAAVGMSPIGGLLHPTYAEDERGVEVRCSGPDAGRPLLVPVSPGIYRHAQVSDSREVELGEVVSMTGPGVVAFDGDRQQPLEPGEALRLRIMRNGPRVVDERRALALAAERGVYLDHARWHDPSGEGGSFDCC